MMCMTKLHLLLARPCGHLASSEHIQQHTSGAAPQPHATSGIYAANASVCTARRRALRYCCYMCCCRSSCDAKRSQRNALELLFSRKMLYLKVGCAQQRAWHSMIRH